MKAGSAGMPRPRSVWQSLAFKKPRVDEFQSELQECRGAPTGRDTGRVETVKADTPIVGLEAC